MKLLKDTDILKHKLDEKYVKHKYVNVITYNDVFFAVYSRKIDVIRCVGLDENYNCGN